MTSVNGHDLSSEPKSPALSAAGPLRFDLEVAKARDELRLDHLGEAIARLEPLTDPHSRRTPTATPASMGSALTVLARTYAASGDHPRALELYDRALQLLDPASSALTAQQWTDRGTALFAKGEAIEAIEALNAARRLQTEPRFETLEILGQVLRDVGRFEEAESALRVAVQLGPEDAGVVLNLARVADTLDRGDAAALYDQAIGLLISGGRFGQLSEAIDGLLALEPTNPRALAAKGEMLRKSGDYEGAIDVLQRSIALDPDEPFALASLGAAFAAIPERPAEALRQLDRALALEPDYPFAQYWRIVTLRDLENWEGALEAADALLVTHGDITDVLTLKALTLRELGRPRDAVDTLRRLVDLAPDDPGARGLLSETLMVAGLYEEALEQIEAVLEVIPDDPLAVGTRGKILMNLGRLEDAIGPLRACAAADPADWVLSALTEVLSRLGRGEEALAEMDAVLEDHPGHAGALREKGELLIGMGRSGEAIAALNDSIAAEPTVWAHVALSDLYRSQERFDDALNEAQNAVDLDPSEAAAIGTRGEALRALGLVDEALADLNAAIEIGKDLLWVHEEKGDILEGRGDLLDAVATYQAALETFPEHPGLLLRTAIDRRLLGQLPGAEAAVRKAIKADPYSVESRTELCEVLFALGQYPESLEAVEAALSLQPGLVRVIQLKGQILVVLGRNEEALPVLDEALELDGNYGWGWGLRAMALNALDRLSEGLESVNKALAILPDDPTLLTEKAAILSAAGEDEKAIQALDAVDMASADLDEATAGWAFSVRGGTYRWAGRWAEAEDALRRAIDVDPADVVARIWLAEAILSNGRVEEGNAILRDLIAETSKRDTLSPDEIANIGWAHRLLGNFDIAAEFFVSALSKDATLVWAQFDFGLTLLWGGAASAAVREYERGLDQVRNKADVRRRYGLVSVAQMDLDQAFPTGAASSAQPLDPAVRQVRAMLQEQLNRDAAERDATATDPSSAVAAPAGSIA